MSEAHRTLDAIRSDINALRENRGTMKPGEFNQRYSELAIERHRAAVREKQEADAKADAQQAAPAKRSRPNEPDSISVAVDPSIVAVDPA